MAEESEAKWEGKAVVEVAGVGAEVVWPVLEDFCNVHKWLPLDFCYHVEGIQGQPGLIRYAGSSSIKGGAATDTATADDTTFTWGKEKLLKMDPVQRCLSYEILDNNLGFKSYVATWKVLDAEIGCKIQWEFACEPVEGWSFQGLYSVIESCLKFMANKIQSLHASDKD
ncbi:lachrymatory-factor synthase-like [Lotus japonicus]|uniref:lachrymatory-factor synthase-like n=1 Tax=Lotus japonicus TaxID=34305 RepID=UPI00258B1D45|nr:lachrymatory-factor synthase-like [Lotus japonicus]